MNWSKDGLTMGQGGPNFQIGFYNFTTRSVPNLGFQLPLETPVPRVVTLVLLGLEKVQFRGFF